MASIRTRNVRRAGRTVIRYQVRWVDPTGRETSRTFGSKATAQDFLLHVESALAFGNPIDPPAPAPTVGQWMAEWLELVADRCATGRLASRTAEGYESKVRLHIVPHLGRVRLDQLTVADVDRWLNRLQAAGLSPGSARHARAVLSTP